LRDKLPNEILFCPANRRKSAFYLINRPFLDSICELSQSKRFQESRILGQKQQIAKFSIAFLFILPKSDLRVIIVAKAKAIEIFYIGALCSQPLPQFLQGLRLRHGHVNMP
jgi:hypothetical protein